MPAIPPTCKSHPRSGTSKRFAENTCARSGYTIIAEYADAAQSGSDTRDRLGYQALMNDAKTGAFDAVIVEAFRRIWPGPTSS